MDHLFSARVLGPHMDDTGADSEARKGTDCRSRSCMLSAREELRRIMNWIIPIVSAMAALAGAYLGGYVADRREREKRHADFIMRQLTEFYGPLVACRAEIDYDNASVSETLLPGYRRMVTIFRDKWSLAEPETRRDFPALVEFVEIWERHLKGVPGDALEDLSYSEENLKPLHAHLETTHERLRRVLAGDSRRSGWLPHRTVMQ